MRPSEVLEQKGWTQNFYARNCNNEPVDADSPSAVKFCLLGSLKFCNMKEKSLTDNQYHSILRYITDKFKRERNYDWSTGYINDFVLENQEQAVALMKEAEGAVL